MRVYISYDPEVFSPDTIVRGRGHLRALITSAVGALMPRSGIWRCSRRRTRAGDQEVPMSQPRPQSGPRLRSSDGLKPLRLPTSLLSRTGRGHCHVPGTTAGRGRLRTRLIRDRGARPRDPNRTPLGKNLTLRSPCSPSWVWAPHMYRSIPLCPHRGSPASSWTPNRCRDHASSGSFPKSRILTS